MIAEINETAEISITVEITKTPQKALTTEIAESSETEIDTAEIPVLLKLLTKLQHQDC